MRRKRPIGSTRPVWDAARVAQLTYKTKKPFVMSSLVIGTPVPPNHGDLGQKPPDVINVSFEELYEGERVWHFLDLANGAEWHGWVAEHVAEYQLFRHSLTNVRVWCFVGESNWYYAKPKPAGSSGVVMKDGSDDFPLLKAMEYALALLPQNNNEIPKHA